ncbi:hypothetical protein KDW19_17535 [Burkholderia cenocepacia]|uniref:hypothetical protein n=1 Tax=Burkholderia cepacia complex TaxID=87882 RepID=UPI000F56D863|nr:MULTISPECIES: hypothetical protein [Burkholderia cepacia complex]ELW9447605.1 hypothetical protein [Burkholderia cenocepacia]MBR8484253.1 hypothetical protein [Burkholderia cenocepacia]MDN7468394.1 hypothetical protein [Burkholderia orbicola]MDN7501531.1 hypothetical protein [Burkholderia orbicola]RQU19152.1 hypothetical protein DF157_11415 [Burkholderia cenocepacia]
MNSTTLLVASACLMSSLAIAAEPAPPAGPQTNASLGYGAKYQFVHVAANSDDDVSRVATSLVQTFGGITGPRGTFPSPPQYTETVQMAYTPVGAVSTHHYPDDSALPDVIPVNGFAVKSDGGEALYDLSIATFQAAGAQLLYRWEVKTAPSSPHQAILKWPGNVVTVAFGGPGTPTSFNAGFTRLGDESVPVTRLYRNADDALAFATALQRAVDARYTVTVRPLMGLGIDNPGVYKDISIESTIGNYEVIALPGKKLLATHPDVARVQSSYFVRSLPDVLRNAVAAQASITRRYYSRQYHADAAIVAFPGGYHAEVVQIAPRTDTTH